ncbi:hypothetical protein HYV87_01180 [Candidatus Woesearchaeota archaeon]|nr:hypothetical protein [Candidatus Woesearchaeota archaeon]
MVKISKLVFVSLVLVLLLPSAISQAEDLENDCIYYFYGQECSDCASLDSLLFGLEREYPHLQIERYEVYHHFQNFELLQAYYDAYTIEKKSRSIPVLFMQGSYLVGSKSISSLLEERIKDNSDPSCPSLSPDTAVVGLLGEGESPNVLSTLTFSLVTGDALRTMFAPGMLALVLLLIAILSATKVKEEIIKNTTYYVSGVFLAYLLFGLGLLSFFYNSQLHYFFYKFVGIAAVLFGLAGVQSFFTAWEIVMPRDLQNYVRQALGFILSPVGVFVVGLVGGMFTLAGVGNSFYLLRDLFIGDFMRGIVLPLMLYYSAVTLLLFVGVAALFHLLRSMLEHAIETQEGSSDVKRERWRKHYQRVLTFCVRGTLFVVGLALVFV